MGLRIEHLQSVMTGTIWEICWTPALEKGISASHRERERGVYTFCMCPGGVVVPSASEWDTVVTNGMSEYARDGRNANAALVVSVDGSDFGANPMDGVSFQRHLGTGSFFGRRRRIHCTGANSKKFFRSNAACSTKIIRTDLFLWSSPISVEKSVS